MKEKQQDFVKQS